MSSIFPQIRPLGLDSLIIRFSDGLDDAANRAVLTFASLVQAGHWDGVEEIAPSLASCLIRFDPIAVDLDALIVRVETVLAGRDWSAIALPANRREWIIPVSLGGETGPQLGEAAALAHRTEADLRALIATTTVRVLALGFAPGQPYMGFLPDAWNIPRQDGLTAGVPAGALVMAVRQLIIYAASAPTGWRQIGMTGFRPFRADQHDPITLRPGDEVSFTVVPIDEIAGDGDGLGGATCRVIP